MPNTTADERDRAARAWMAAAIIAAVLTAAWLGAFAPLDQALRAVRFQASDRPPSGETLFVEIDSVSLATIGVWPWPRQLHAEMLDRLLELGAAEVVFDIDFSTASTREGDLALEQALERAGGYAFLATFRQTLLDGSAVLNRPLPRFAAHAGPVLVNVDGDGTGLVHSVPASLPELGIPSVAKALAGPAAAIGPALVIDFGIDVEQIERVSAAELLLGEPDPALFADKQVIVGASAIELRDFFRVPRFGVIPGPLVQLAATETLKAGRQLREFGAGPAAALALLAALAFALPRRRASLGQLAILGLAAMALVEAAAVLAQGLGAVAFDTAPFHLAIVLLVLAGLLHERTTRWGDYLRQQARLAFLATHDPSSGALSRQALLDQLGPHLAQGGSASLVLVQLGRLDSAIASLGHDVGEATAAEVVRRLERCLGGKPARIGIDLFAFGRLEALEPAQQLALCHRVAAALDQPYFVDGHVVLLDTRLGSTSVTGEGVTASELLRQADVALAHARAENAKTMAFGREQSERINQRRLRDIALRQALDNREFFLLYQPQYELATNTMTGVEALVRWQNKTLGMVSPVDFIPLAEETGLIVPLGDWIMAEACRQAAGWAWTGRLSVNVSSAQFRLGDVVKSVSQALSGSGFPAHRLDLEITESLLVDNDRAILANIEALRGMGVSIAMDDFGTGYSSLSYLSRLPIDKLKIDQSFVRPLPDPSSEALVETILLMAKRLGKHVVAEGIESVEQRDYLARLGCQTGQGYLLGRPALPEALGLVARPAAEAEPALPAISYGA